jgi:oligoendopeptidase F
MSVFADRWSLTDYFPALESAEYLSFLAALKADLAAAQARLTQADVAWAEEIAGLESLFSRLGHVSSYLGCRSSDDANDEAVKAAEAKLAQLEAELTKLRSTLQAGLAQLDEAAFADVVKSPAVEGIGYAATRLRAEGRHLMPPALEGLAADLNVDGLHAWGRLYNTLTGKLKFTMTFPDGHTEEVPMARRRALLAEPDRRVRLAAFTAGQTPWEEQADTFAAALNGLAGTRLSLYRRRQQPHFLDAPLFDSGVSRATLDALRTAWKSNLALSHRALRAAAKRQGTAALHYADLEAPQVAAPADQSVTWEAACTMVRDSFHAAYPALGEYFDEMLAQRWIEAQPRAGKRPGAFCTGSTVLRQERVYMTYHDTIHDVVTLAHEVGHAWHSRVLRPARPFASNYPMTLAETASNFGEMILLHGLLQHAPDGSPLRAYLLDQEMLRAHAYLVNIPMRFEFEHAFYAERTEGEVSVSRLRELMTQAQRDLYGDTLSADGTDPMFWAYKMHFFITEVSFYNFPYVFGYLLSQALFARFQAEGASFLPAYEKFLAATGSASCEDVARQTLGADLTDPAFWTGAIRALEPQVGAYEKLP